MTSIWSYSDFAGRGFGLFKRCLFAELKNLGWNTVLAEASLIDSNSRNYLREHLLQHPTEWILLINQSAAQLYDYLQLPANNRPLPAKKIVWYLDNPAFFVNQPFEPLEWVFCFDETYLGFLKRFNPAYCGFLPLAADATNTGRKDSRLECEVSFVGGLIDQSERRSQLSQDMVNYVDLLVEKKIQHREQTFQELAAEFPFAPGKQITITPQVEHYLYWEANNRYRIRILELLSDLDLHIYGNEDWTKLLAESPLLKHFRGPIDPVTELPDLFVSSKINLNIHSIQCRGSLNQRDFNAPVADGFLLSDWVPAAGKYFDPGFEAVYWGNNEDLRSKVFYYLNHPEECQDFIQRARQKVETQHTYRERVQRILQGIGYTESYQ